MFPLIPLALAVIAVLVIRFRDGEWRLKLFSVPALYFLCLLVLTPWWVVLSERFGEMRITPISQELTLAVLYGRERLLTQSRKVQNRDFPKSGRGSNPFGIGHTTAHTIADKKGIPLPEAYKEVRENALKGLTLSSAIKASRGAWERYLANAGTFNRRFESSAHWKANTSRQFLSYGKIFYQKLFVSIFGLSIIFTIIPFWGSLSQQFLPIAYKGTFCLVCLQPFVHHTNFRHHLFAVPIFILGALLLFRECRRVLSSSSFGGMAMSERVLFFAQLAGGLVVLTVAATMAFYPV